MPLIQTKIYFKIVTTKIKKVSNSKILGFHSHPFTIFGFLGGGEVLTSPSSDKVFDVPEDHTASVFMVKVLRLEDPETSLTTVSNVLSQAEYFYKPKLPIHV